MVTAVVPSAGSGSTAQSAESPTLANAAKEFETVLLSQWLQDAESSFASVPGADSDTDAGSDQLKGFATQQLASSFAASGGIGISKLVLRALTKAGAKEQGNHNDAAIAVTSPGGAAAMTDALTAYKAEARR